MTPLEIEILLHYYYSGEDFRKGDFSAPAVRAAIDLFQVLDGGSLLTKDPCDMEKNYTITDRGRAYVNALCSMPLPVSKWVMPEPLNDI